MIGIGLGINFAAMRGGGGDAVLPSDGLIADWRFSEGTGTTVADETGTYPIDLTLAATPNTVWESFGLSADGGAIQTPSITGVRTICMFYRVEKNGTGFHVSGPAAVNGGPIGGSIGGLVGSGGWAWIGQGMGVGRVAARVSDGQSANWQVSGGWRVAFFEYGAAANGFLTFGSRGNSTLNRFAEFEIAWAGVYNKALTDVERDQIYNWCRGLSVERSINLDFRDMVTRADCIIGWGQSNMDGRAQISALSAPDQARVYDDVQIIQSPISATTTEQFELLDLGGNHNAQSSTLFGSEIPWANLREDNPTGRELWIIKSAQGGTYLAPIAVSGAGVGWSAEESAIAGGFYGGLLRTIYQAIGDALLKGVGLDLKAFVAYQGEQDALQPATADIWEAQFNLFISEFERFTPFSDFPIYVTRIRDASPTDATAYATVRAAQASVVATFGSRATLVDVDGYSFGDPVHLDATGMQSYAAFIWDDLGL